jgi:hypothetical protein
VRSECSPLILDSDRSPERQWKKPDQKGRRGESERNQIEGAPEKENVVDLEACARGSSAYELGYTVAVALNPWKETLERVLA